MQLDHFHFDTLDKIVAMVVACGGEHVTIAGGAVRDSVLEKDIKDIDVFFQGELNEEAVTQMFGAKKEKPVKWGRPVGPLLCPDFTVPVALAILNRRRNMMRWRKTTTREHSL